MGAFSAPDAPLDLLSKKVGKVALAEADPFVALNTAFLQEGVWLVIEKACKIVQPLYVHHYTTTHGAVGSHPRFFVHMEPHSDLQMVEIFYAPSQQTIFLNEVQEIVMEQHAKLDHYVLQMQTLPSVYQMHHKHVLLEESSAFASYHIVASHAFVRNATNLDFAGSHSSGKLHGSYLVQGGGYIENQQTCVHRVPHAQSSMYYKGIALEEGRGVFHGASYVEPGAQKTNASQYHHGWAVDKKASIYARPELFIEADDVICKHGATMGQGVEEAIFYLRTRGIPRVQAQRMLLEAFVEEPLDKASLPLKKYLIGFLA